jgi:hypothetical protein
LGGVVGVGLSAFFLGPQADKKRLLKTTKAAISNLFIVEL